MELNNLHRLSDQQLIKAYYALNNYNWPKALGEKPQGWDRLPNYRPLNTNPFTAIRYRKTKQDIIEPYLNEIAMHIGHRWLKENKGRNQSLKDTFDLFLPPKQETN